MFGIGLQSFAKVLNFASFAQDLRYLSIKWTIHLNTFLNTFAGLEED